MSMIGPGYRRFGAPSGASVPSVASFAALPAAAASAGLVYRTANTSAVYFSDGTNWIELGGWPSDLYTAGEEIFSRRLATAAAAAVGSGNIHLEYWTARRTEAITRLKMITGATPAAATPTLGKMGMYLVAANGDLTLLAATANDTSLFATANTAYTRALTSTFNKVRGQRYAFAELVVSAGATPTFVGNSALTTSQPASEVGSGADSAPRLTGTVAAVDLTTPIVAASVVDNVRSYWGAVLP